MPDLASGLSLSSQPFFSLSTFPHNLFLYLPFLTIFVPGTRDRSQVNTSTALDELCAEQAIGAEPDARDLFSSLTSQDRCLLQPVLLEPLPRVLLVVEVDIIDMLLQPEDASFQWMADMVFGSTGNTSGGICVSKTHRNYSPEAPNQMAGKGVLLNAFDQIFYLLRVRFFTC